MEKLKTFPLMLSWSAKRHQAAVAADHCGGKTSEVGGLSSTGKSFRVVRACVRCVCLVSSGQKSLGGGFPFSLLA